jgi:hypothetical protein
MFDEIGCTEIGCIWVDNCYFLLCMSLFISMKHPSLSHLINVNLKSTLSDVSIANSACLGGHWPGKSSSSLSP